MAFRPEKLLRGFFRTISVIVLAAVLGLTTAGIVFFYNLTRGLPDVKTLKQYQHTHTSEVYSDDGKKIGEFTTERRYPVEFDKIPKHVIQSFLAAEDSKFFQHKGIDLIGIARAMLTNVLRRRAAQGASTITQQVARGLLLSSRKKEITRKIREMILARRMEEELSKNEILALYLNDIYLGHGAFGIGAASLNYFRKRVEELSVAEGAMLAGLPQRPNEWDPFRNPYLAKQRQRYVLRRMIDEKFVTEAQARQAVAEPLKLYQLEELNDKVAPYFTEYVRQYLMKRYGSEKILTEGYKVHTTVRHDFQKHAEKVVDVGLRQVDKRLGWRGVTLHLDSAEKIETFLLNLHDQVVSDLTPLRILRPNVEPKTKKLDYELAQFSETTSSYFGQTPVLEGKIYRAVVTGANDSQMYAQTKVGKTTVSIPWSQMSWVVEKDPRLKLVSQVLKPGDVIELKVTKVDKRSFVAEGSLEQPPEIQGALLSYDINTGFVRAMVGGTDFEKSKFNIAIQAKRQVGSTFKPVIYAAALDRGFSPSSIVTDSPLVFKFDEPLDADNTGEPWRPHNYSGRFEGDIPMRLALIRSMNIPTVKILNELSIDYVIQYARTLGITSTLQRDLSIALGSWSSSLEELTRAYSVFPRLGRPIGLVYIKKVVDASGKVLEETRTGDALVAPTPDSRSGPQGKNAAVAKGGPEDGKNDLPEGTVISPQTAYVMTDMLRGVVREGTGTAAAVIAGAAGKTGTSNDHRDAWFVGYTPHVMTGIWLGYEKDRPLDPEETGGKAAAPIWAEYMAKVVPSYPRPEYPVPDDVVFAYINRETGRLASSSSVGKRVRVAFKVGTVPGLEEDSLPRIGEPGTRPIAQDHSQPGNAAQSPSPNKSDETNDFLRQGYD